MRPSERQPGALTRRQPETVGAQRCVEPTRQRSQVVAEPDLVERVVRDSLTAEIDRIVIDSRAVFERIRDMTSRISRRVKNRVKLYDGAAPIFEHFEVEKQLENAFRRKVWLKSGGYLIFDETEALVAIDVNTGRHKGGQNQEESILQVNTEAAGEVARQLVGGGFEYRLAG